MRALLLAPENDLILAIAVFCLFLAVAILFTSYFKKKLNYSSKNTRSSNNQSKVKVHLHTPFISADSFMFYNALQRALPPEFTAFPNVGIDTIVKPAGDLEGYKLIADEHLDFVVFKKDGMVPAAVIDLIDPGTSLNVVARQKQVVTKTLLAINLPVLEFTVEEQYVERKILERFLDSQDPYTIAMLKKQRQEKSSNNSDDYE